MEKTTQKVSITADSQILDRARSAFLMDGPRRGIRSFSAWVAEAIEEKTQTVEDEQNEGQPFPPTKPGIIPTGRRP